MDEHTQEFALNIVRQIAYLDAEELEAGVKDAKAARQHWDSIGVMLDPTTWHRMADDGSFERSDAQVEMLEYLLAIRKLIDKHEALVPREGA